MYCKILLFLLFNLTLWAQESKFSWFLYAQQDKTFATYKINTVLNTNTLELRAIHGCYLYGYRKRILGPAIVSKKVSLTPNSFVNDQASLMLNLQNTKTDSVWLWFYTPVKIKLLQHQKIKRFLNKAIAKIKSKRKQLNTLHPIHCQKVLLDVFIVAFAKKDIQIKHQMRLNVLTSPVQIEVYLQDKLLKKNQILKHNDQCSLKIVNYATFPLFLYGLRYGKEGSKEQLYPNNRLNVPIRPGQSLILPSATGHYQLNMPGSEYWLFFYRKQSSDLQVLVRKLRKWDSKKIAQALFKTPHISLRNWAEIVSLPKEKDISLKQVLGWHIHKYLANIDIKYQGDLNKGKIPLSLYKILAHNGYMIENAKVQTIRPNQQWSVLGNNRKYYITKGQNSLNVYLPTRE